MVHFSQAPCDLSIETIKSTLKSRFVISIFHLNLRLDFLTSKRSLMILAIPRSSRQMNFESINCFWFKNVCENKPPANQKRINKQTNDD